MMRQAMWLVALVIGGAVWAQGLQALARVNVSQPKIEEGRNGSISLQLELSQPVPFRVFTLDNPARVVMDLATPVVPDQTELRVDDTRGTATLQIDMIAASAKAFADFSTVREQDGWALPKGAAVGGSPYDDGD